MSFTIPESAGQMTGSAFILSIMNMPLGDAREQAILHQYQLGNVPTFMRTPVQISVTAGEHHAVFDVLPDVLCVGSDDDFVRTPMNPKTAQQVADNFGGMLITPYLSDQIWRQARVHLEPKPLPPTAEMTSTKYIQEHNHLVELARSGRSGLIAGHKKDVVLADTLALPEFHDARVAIYGWHQLNGVPIQGLNPSPGEKLTHEITYADYSHGIRLVANTCLVDGAAAYTAEVAMSPTLGYLFNKTGPLKYLRYPTS